MGEILKLIIFMLKMKARQNIKVKAHIIQTFLTVELPLIVLGVRLKQISKEKTRDSKSTDMHFKPEARLTYWMMGIGGGSMAKKQLRPVNSPGN